MSSCCIVAWKEGPLNIATAAAADTAADDAVVVVVVELRLLATS